ncbi:MAG: hypothetical protein WAT74_14560 [Flavobacteriales bacterium]
MNRLFALLLLAAPFAMPKATGQWNVLTNSGYQAVKSITSGGGAVYMVATSTSTFSATVYKSIDGGSSWNPSGTGLPGGQAVQSVHFASGVLLCGTESGIYRSTNAGASWVLANPSPLPTASASNYVKKFFQFGSTTLAVFSATIGGGGGIYRSTDGGVQWFNGNNGLATNMIVNQVCEAGGLLYTATSTGLANSNNLSVSWNQIPTANFACYGVQGTASRLVIISSLGYRYSTNGGSTWNNATGTPNSPTGGELILYDGAYWAINTASPMDVLRSTNNAQSFSVYEGGLQGADVISQNAFHASGNTLYLGCFTNIYGHPGTTLGVTDAQPEELSIPYPTVFTDGFFLNADADQIGNAVVLFDGSGREVLRQVLSSQGINWIQRAGLSAGTYHAALAERSSGLLHPLGKLVAQ